MGHITCSQFPKWHKSKVFGSDFLLCGTKTCNMKQIGHSIRNLSAEEKTSQLLSTSQRRTLDNAQVSMTGAHIHEICKANQDCVGCTEIAI